MSATTNAADVLIVCGGSAGAVLAARLGEGPARRVMLLEDGPAYGPDASHGCARTLSVRHRSDEELTRRSARSWRRW